jgi:hypothetical protein
MGKQAAKGKGKRGHFTPAPKKTLVDPVHAIGSSLSRLQAFFSRSTTLVQTPAVFDLNQATERGRLIRVLYSGQYDSSLLTLGPENPELSQLLHLVTNNTYIPTPARRELYCQHRARMFEGLFSQLFRMRSQKLTTLLAVLVAIEARKTHVEHNFYDTLVFFFRGALMSTDWVERFLPEALTMDPGCPFPQIPGFMMAAFDNLQIRIGYKAFSTEDTRDVSTNYRLDLTNWMIFHVHPRIGRHLHVDTLHNIAPPPHPPPTLPPSPPPRTRTN